MLITFIGAFIEYKHYRNRLGFVLFFMPIILALGSLRQQDCHKFKISLS